MKHFGKLIQQENLIPPDTEKCDAQSNGLSLEKWPFQNRAH